MLTDNLEDHLKIIQVFKDNAVPHHSYTPKEHRRTNLVLLNLCRSYDSEDIIAAINALGLNVKISQVTQFATEKSRREGSNLSMWLVQLEPQSDVEALLRTTRLLNQIVRFEHKESKGVAQCHNCQHFGHASVNCNRPYRCVKCIDQHLPGQCPINTLRAASSVEIKPRCVNCLQEHAANFRGCTAYRTYVKIKAERLNSAKKQQEDKARDTQKSGKYNQRQPNISYADATRSDSQASVNVLNFFEAECADKFGINLTELLAKASRFGPEYSKLPDNQKPMALIKFALSIAPLN